MSDVARISGGLEELGAAVERDRLLWRARLANVERAVEQTLQLAQEIRWGPRPAKNSHTLSSVKMKVILDYFLRV